MVASSKNIQGYVHPMGHTTQTIWDACCCKIYGYIFKRVKDPATTDDIMQETFVKIHEKLHTLKDGNKIHNWVFQIVNNTINDHYRRHKVMANDIEASKEHCNPPEFPGGEKERDLEKEITSGLLPLIESLPGIYSEALLMVEYEGMSQVDLAKKLKISVSAVKSRVQRARQMVKDRLMDCCHYEFDKYGTVIGVKLKTCCCCNHQ